MSTMGAQEARRIQSMIFGQVKLATTLSRCRKQTGRISIGRQMTLSASFQRDTESVA